MVWARLLAYVTGAINQELLLKNEYLVAENRILKTKVRGGWSFPKPKSPVLRHKSIRVEKSQFLPIAKENNRTFNRKQIL